MTYQPVTDWTSITHEPEICVPALKKMYREKREEGDDHLVEFCHMNKQWSFRICRPIENT